MKNLIQGLREFKDTYVVNNQEFLEQLSEGQKPRVLFVTCSDSRIVPSLITQTEPGELFVIRNAGNIIPPFGAANGGEGAAVEYAIQALGIQQVIVCGHSHCGAMKGLLQIGKLEEEMPLVYEWLRHADATRRLVTDNYQGYSKDEMLEIAIAENVLTQIENLKTYPIVHSRLYQGNLHIYAWIYLIETGEVLAYDIETHTYMPPQTQLEESGQPGQYRITQAPPVTCDLPPYLDELETTAKPQVSTQSSSSSTAKRPANSTDNSSRGNGKSQSNDITWLSPEQVDRIYRGSASR